MAHPPTVAASSTARRRLVGAVLLVGLVVAVGFVGAGPAGAAPTAQTCNATGTISRGQAVEQLREVRRSIDRTLRLLDAGRRTEAFRESRTGYLDCFEAVEAQLDVVAGADFRFQVEDVFARVRGLIETKASTA